MLLQDWRDVEARRAMKQLHARLEEGWREPYAHIAPLAR